MRKAKYTQVCINKFIQKVCPTQSDQKDIPVSEPTEQPLETPQPSTSQAEGENENKTRMTRGAKKILGIQMLKLMGRVFHGIKDMSVDMKTLTKDVGALTDKIDNITAIYGSTKV